MTFLGAPLSQAPVSLVPFLQLLSWPGFGPSALHYGSSALLTG